MAIIKPITWEFKHRTYHLTIKLEESLLTLNPNVPIYTEESLLNY